MVSKRVFIFATLVLALVAASAFADNAYYNLATGSLQMVVDGSGNPLGALDITNNKGFIGSVQTSTSTAGPWTYGDATTVAGFMASGFAGGAQNGWGINSSYAALDATGNFYTTVGWMPGDSAINYLGMSTFGTHTIASSDTLFKWTYYGDSNFDGVVNDDDFGFINYAYSLNGTPDEGSVSGWMWGDFNNDGAVNDDDYGYINYVYSTGGNPYGTLSAGDIKPVPEPTTIVLLISSVACALFVSLRKR